MNLKSNTFKDGVYNTEENAIPHERKRKGPFLSMFPGSAPKLINNILDADVGEPLILTPFLESGQIQKARELSMVKNLSTSGSSANIETYSGFLTVNKTYDSNLFFWFAPAQVRSLEYKSASLLQFLHLSVHPFVIL